MNTYNLNAAIYLAFASCVSVFYAESVEAEYIVDTGPGLNVLSGSSISQNQSLAAEFTIDKSYVITEIDGWIFRSGGSDIANVAISSNDGDYPGSELFSSNFSVIPTLTLDWYGPTDLDWSLPIGTYWVVFRVLDSDFQGGMPDATNSYLNEAYFNTFNGRWVRNYEDLGVKIQGTAVPIPPTLLLFCSGLLGLIGIARGKKAA